MANVNILPEELLEKIAVRLYIPGKKTSDLAAFCAVSKKFNRIGSSILYKLFKLGLTPKVAHTRITLLLQTLVTNPDLAQLVHSLDLYVLEQRKRKIQEGIPEYKTFSRLLINDAFQSTARLRYDLRRNFTYDMWADSVKQGQDFAMAGLLLLRVPNLRHLSIRSTGFRPVFYWQPAVPQLHHLVSITSNIQLPWWLVTLPTLHSLEFDIQNIANDSQFYRNYRLKCNPSGSERLHITILTFKFRYNIVLMNAFDVLELYCKRLLDYAPILENLHIYIQDHPSAPLRRRHRVRTALTVDLFYRTVRDLFGSNPLQSLRELIVFSAGQLTQDSNSNFLRLMNKIHLNPSLERLVLRQDSLVEFDGMTIDPPPALRSLEIIDSTSEFDTWATNHLLRRIHGNRYPRLEQVVLWCDVLAEPRVLDPRHPRVLLQDMLQSRGINLILKLHGDTGWKTPNLFQFSNGSFV